MYDAEISRQKPTAYVFLVDQSGSMADSMTSGRSKAEFVSDVLNKTLRDLIVRCTKEEGVRDYFDIAVIGYGGNGISNGIPSGGGEFLQKISHVNENVLRVEEREKLMDDGAGGLVGTPVKFPVWFEPSASGGTPMCAAIAKAAELLADWCNSNENSYPPTVLHVTDGESTDGDPINNADVLTQISTSNGSVLMYNIHVSSAGVEPVKFPTNESQLPDMLGKVLFKMSSNFPEHVIEYARTQHGINLNGESKAMVLNAEAEEIVKFLDIGSRPAAMR